MKIVLDHIVLNVENISKAVGFYQEVLELEIERLTEFEKGLVGFPSVRLNQDTVIDLFPATLWKNSEENQINKLNLNHFCLTMSEHDWKRLTDRLKLNNVEITKYTDTNWGAKGIGISIYFNDVDGNEIEARYYSN